MSYSHEQQPGAEEFASLLEIGYAPVIHSVFTAAIELKVFDIIAQSGPDAYLSAFEIAAKLPKKTEDTSRVLDRMLQLLTSQSILDCRLVNDEDGKEGSRKYGLNSLSKFLASDENGLSLAPPVVYGNAIRESCYYLKDSVLEGGVPFNKAHDGMNVFEMMRTNPILNESINNAMRSRATYIMREIHRVYQGFDNLKKVVDVGGGLGSTIQSVVSKYPHIHGINFDLPQVIKNAPTYPGVEHIEGDMFQEVPTADAIILKYILHDWSDEGCKKLLKNCHRALPESGGKVIVIEMILPETPATDVVSRRAYIADVLMHVITGGGKERTLKEFENLAHEGGFKSSKLVSRAYQYGIFEFYKD